MMATIIEPGTKWFVWCKKGRPPRFAHATEESALAEAQRLAEKAPGATFHVMKSVAKVFVAPVEITESAEASL